MNTISLDPRIPNFAPAAPAPRVGRKRPTVIAKPASQPATGRRPDPIRVVVEAPPPLPPGAVVAGGSQRSKPGRRGEVLADYRPRSQRTAGTVMVRWLPWGTEGQDVRVEVAANLTVISRPAARAADVIVLGPPPASSPSGGIEIIGAAPSGSSSSGGQAWRNWRPQTGITIANRSGAINTAAGAAIQAAAARRAALAAALADMEPTGAPPSSSGGGGAVVAVGVAAVGLPLLFKLFKKRR